jgi:hypothetical protein
LAAVEALLESGLVPLSGGVAAAAARQPAPPATSAKPSIPVGFRELREGLDKADRESVIFGAKLGAVPMANRSGLANAFSIGLKEAVIGVCSTKKCDPAESIRDMDDALSCVSDMEFLGAKSKKYLKEGDPLSNTYCTLPVKVRFDDRNSRINFERTLREHTGMRASMSLLVPIWDEMKAFKQALIDRYPGEVVNVRIDTVSAELYALRKVDKADSWTPCSERFRLPTGILLPGYKAGAGGRLPPLVSEPAPLEAGSGINNNNQ